MRVYKFYSAKYALESLRHRRLKISTVSDLNDPFEFCGPAISERGDRRTWRKTVDATMASTGLISFSSDWNDPVIWSHYGENHKGIALGFDVHDKFLTKVTYSSKRPALHSLEPFQSEKFRQIFEASLSTKYEKWSYEKEYRLFCRLEETDPDTGLYFRKFDKITLLREIILGPRCKITSQELARFVDIKWVKVITSRIAFKSYSVVPQNDPKLQK